MTITTPMPPAAVTRGTRVRVAGTAYWVRDTTTADDGSTVVELDDHTTLTVPVGGTVQVIGKPAAVAL